jgi:aryl-alcohol dehydrogenase-like predicted oxidoreductase
LVVRDIERDLLPLCTDQELGMIGYSPLGGGFLTGKYRPGEPPPEGSRLAMVPGMQPIYLHAAGFRVLDALRAKAVQTAIPLPLLALAWAIGEPRIASVLIGARTPEHVDQALQADALRMPEGLRAELNALSQ